MIQEISKNNLEILDGSFLNRNVVYNDLDTNPFGHYLVYINEQGKILGFLYYSDIYERAEINQLEVQLINRNCGIASKLLEKMIGSVQKSITLEVRKDNHSAIHLYKKFNFRQIGIRKNYYNSVDAILMERKSIGK